MRRNVVAVDALRSAMTFEAKRDPTQSIGRLEYQDNILESSLKSVPDSMRVYFISSKNSLFLPIKFSEVHDSALLLQPFFKLGTPPVNLMRSPYWTKSSESDFSNGLIISRAAPIYIDDRFIGVVGVDILLNNLMDTVSEKVYGDANIFVVGHDRNLLLHSRFNTNLNRDPIAAVTALPPELQPHLEQILQGKSGEMQSMAGYRVMHYNLQNVPWNFVLWIPEGQLWLTTIKSSFWSSVIPWLGLMTMLAVIMAEVRRRNAIQSNLQLKTIELSDTLTQLKQAQARLIQNEIGRASVGKEC